MFARQDSAIFVPDGVVPTEALARTTHLGVGAHADDLEIMAIPSIPACCEDAERWFCGVVVTDGTGSPGTSSLGTSAEDRATLRDVRRREQERAAMLGRYGAQIFLDYASADVKEPRDDRVVTDLVTLLRAPRPEVVYTHALSDAHETHVAVTLRVIAACRALPTTERPDRVLGCEVWRDLDWLSPVDKICLPADERPELQAELIGAFTSQLGAKNYVAATLGRRAAHAAFSDSHASDRHRGVVWAMDLSPLVAGTADVGEYARGLVRRLEDDVLGRIRRLGG